jgi:hypothetical protein
MQTYELSPRYDARQSFYGKARVIEDNGVLKLWSYDTHVASIKGNKAEVYGTYSTTTLRHIKEFLLQNNFEAVNKKQIVATYNA